MYLTAQEVANVFELYAVPTVGQRAPRELNGALMTSADVLDIRIARNGERIVYRAEQDSNGRSELYTRWPVSVSESSSVLDFHIASGGKRIVYRGDRGSVIEIYMSFIPPAFRSTP